MKLVAKQCVAAAAVLLIATLTQEAQAGFVRLANTTDLNGSDVTTAPYSGTSGSAYATPFLATAGTNAVSFTTAGGSVFRIDNSGVYAGVYDYASGATLLASRDANGNPTGPLTISFATPVFEFGFRAQDDAFDTETITFTAYEGNLVLGSYTTPPTDNMTGAGAALFFGGRSSGSDFITRIVVSSVSSVSVLSNDVVVGAITLGSSPLPNRVPEPPTLVLALLPAALLLRSRRRTRTST